MSTPSLAFTVAQQAAAFAASVGAVAGFKFRTLEDMQKYAIQLSNINLKDLVIQGYMGSDWEAVWGPVVWVNPAQHRVPLLVDHLVVDNTMACYYSHSQKLFVLAIAGTNPASMFDWGQEDDDIKTLVPWAKVSPGSDPASGSISAGTFNGIKALQGMTHKGDSMVSKLANYININNIGDATIAVAGHSLGGALAPCMGLYLYDNLNLLPIKQKIAVYAYAGPTPGDRLFAKYYEGRLNSSAFANSSVYNTLDIVPQAWAMETLKTIPQIYVDNIPFADTPKNTFLGVLATKMQLASFLKGYTQVSTGRQPFTAPFNAEVYNSCSAKVAALIKDMPIDHTYTDELGALVNVLYQADAQHTAAYFGGTISLPLPGAPDGIWKSHPVQGSIGIDAYTVQYQHNLAANPPPVATFVSTAARMLEKVIGLDLHDMAALRTAVAPKTAQDPAAVA